MSKTHRATARAIAKKDELSLFEAQGLRKISFEDYKDNEEPAVRRFRATYRREK